MFFTLGCPDRLIDATVTFFLNSAFVEKEQVQKNNATSEGNIVRVILPFKEQRSADENSSKTLAATSAIQYKRYSRVQKLALASNVLYISLNVICAIQIISATLLIISI